MQNITAGTDIIEIARIQKAAEKEKFLTRIFTANELEYYKNNGKRIEILAGMFCAKEAAAKAMTTGVRGFGFCDIEVCHTIQGMPFLKFYGAAQKIFAGKNSSVSIAHCSSYATAVCIFFTSTKDNSCAHHYF